MLCTGSLFRRSSRRVRACVARVSGRNSRGTTGRKAIRNGKHVWPCYGAVYEAEKQNLERRLPLTPDPSEVVAAQAQPLHLCVSCIILRDLQHSPLASHARRPSGHSLADALGGPLSEVVFGFVTRA